MQFSQLNKGWIHRQIPHRSKMRLAFQCGLIFRRRVSGQLFESFVKRASMGKKAAQRQGINGM
jgi:hypothetical protein